jgi:hypothetical protein
LYPSGLLLLTSALLKRFCFETAFVFKTSALALARTFYGKLDPRFVINKEESSFQNITPIWTVTSESSTLDCFALLLTGLGLNFEHRSSPFRFRKSAKDDMGREVEFGLS